MFETTISWSVKKDSQPYADCTLVYHNMEKADVVEVEDALVGGLFAKLLELAKADVSA